METKAIDHFAAGTKQIDMRSNCLNLFRLWAAILVFYGHAIAAFATEQPDWAMPIVKLAFLFEMVPFFFAVSGFLLWSSLGRTKHFGDYLKNRVLRLYPEMWGAVILNAVVTLILNFKNITWWEFIAYQFTQSTFLQFWTPDSLQSFSNGPLWTVCVMVQCYVVLWPLYRFLHGKGLKRWLPTLAACVAINLVKPLLKPFLPAILYKLIWYTFANHLWLFLLGAFLCEYFPQVIGWLKKFWWLAFPLQILVFYTKFDVGSYAILNNTLMILGVLGFAYRYPNLNIKTDLSYGLYLYHMIVINTMVFFHLFDGGYLCILMALIPSVLLALASYFSTGAISRRAKAKGKLKLS